MHGSTPFENKSSSFAAGKIVLNITFFVTFNNITRILHNYGEALGY